MITRWGLPEGVGRLTDEQFRHGNSTLMFIRRGRQGAVYEIRQVNSRGVYPPLYTETNLHRLSAANPLQQVDYRGLSTEFLETCRLHFEHDGDNQILNQVAYNRGGSIPYIIHNPISLCIARGHFQWLFASPELRTSSS